MLYEPWSTKVLQELCEATTRSKFNVVMSQEYTRDKSAKFRTEETWNEGDLVVLQYLD